MQLIGVTRRVVLSEVKTLRICPSVSPLSNVFCQLLSLNSSKCSFVSSFVVKATISLALDMPGVKFSETSFETSSF